MSNNVSKKKLNAIIGCLLLAVGVIFILCGIYTGIVDYLLGAACCAAAVALAIKGIIAKKKVLIAAVVIAALLLAAGIAFFVYQQLGNIIYSILEIALITVGAVILVDSVVWFVKKRALAINIVELIIALALIAVGVASICTKNLLLLYVFSGSVVILAGIIVIIASLVDFNKYKNAQQPSAPAKTNNKKHK